MRDPLSVTASLLARIALAGGLAALIWLGVFWALRP
jgi:hypothetical protein